MNTYEKNVMSLKHGQKLRSFSKIVAKCHILITSLENFLHTLSIRPQKIFPKLNNNVQSFLKIDIFLKLRFLNQDLSYGTTYRKIS